MRDASPGEAQIQETYFLLSDLAELTATVGTQALEHLDTSPLSKTSWLIAPNFRTVTGRESSPACRPLVVKAYGGVCFSYPSTARGNSPGLGMSMNRAIRFCASKSDAPLDF